MPDQSNPLIDAILMALSKGGQQQQTMQSMSAAPLPQQPSLPQFQAPQPMPQQQTQSMARPQPKLDENGQTGIGRFLSQMGIPLATAAVGLAGGGNGVTAGAAGFQGGYTAEKAQQQKDKMDLKKLDFEQQKLDIQNQKEQRAHERDQMIANWFMKNSAQPGQPGNMVPQGVLQQQPQQLQVTTSAGSPATDPFIAHSLQHAKEQGVSLKDVNYKSAYDRVANGTGTTADKQIIDEYNGSPKVVSSVISNIDVGAIPVVNNEEDRQAVLSQLPAEVATNIQGAGEYNLDVTKLYGLRNNSENRAKFDALVQKIYPGWNMGEYASRQTFKNQFFNPNGQTGTAINSIKQVTYHLGNLHDDVAALQNSGIPLLNKPLNWWRSNLEGNPQLTSVITDITAVNEELTKAWAGNNNGLERVREWQKSLNIAKSPAQWQAVFSSAGNLLNGAIDARQSQYKFRMKQDIKLLDPDQQQILDSLQAEYGGGQAQSQVISEGQTATNPQTGKKIIFKGGQWQPMQ